MKTLKKFEFPVAAATGGGQSKYDWAKMFDGGIYQLVHGEGGDFTGDPQNFRMMIKARAELLHKNVQVHIDKSATPIVITLQASPMTDEQIAEADAHIEHKKALEKARRDKKKSEKATTPSTSVESTTAETQPVS